MSTFNLEILIDLILFMHYDNNVAISLKLFK